jgi:hypothetical protein
MWTYIIGPFLALLPRRWQKALPYSDTINWPHAVTLSGLAELAVALAATVEWYSISMTTWVNRGLEVAMNSKAGEGITDHAIGGMAWLMWVNHPLTWLFGYFCMEGAVRMCGATFSDNLLGTLPLAVVDKVARYVLYGSKTAEEVPGAAASFFGAVSEKVLESSVPVSADEVRFQQSATDEILEIRASRRKPEWDPPRVVRFQENYYRLEACSKCPGPRPFRYTLRRLPAGVPGRTVIVYEPGDAVLAEKR